MSDVIHLQGEGGAVWKMTLPLSPHIARRYEAGELQRVNPDGSPYQEPAPKRTRASKAAAAGADPFASADDAAGYGFALPAASADGLLARATQALVDAAGFGILSGSATVRVTADDGILGLWDIPLVTAVTALDLVHEDGTTEAVTDYHQLSPHVGGTVRSVVLGPSVPGRHCGRFAVTLAQGLPSVPDSLKMLTSAVAYRFAAMPAAMSAGITSRSVGGVSWSTSKPPPSGDLTDGELCKLARIVPVRTVWSVPGVILGSDTVTILRGRTRDNFGNLQGSDTATDVSGCSVQPTSASESTDRGELLVTNLTVYLPAGTDILATDRVRWLGTVYAVNGPPAVWNDELGNVDHVQAQLLLKEGQG